jgi:hypothetical protein
MTPKQVELLKVAERAFPLVGGHRGVAVAPDRNTEGSKIWAIKQAMGAMCGVMPDDEACQYLIDCINR